MQGFVEAKARLEFGDEIRIKPLSAAVLPAEGIAAARVRKSFGCAGARNPFGDVYTNPGELGDDLLNRAAGRDLDNQKVDHHDREQGRDNQ